MIIDADMLPPRPTMPTKADQERAVHQLARYQILTEDWDDLLREYMERSVPAERLTLWGPPDTSTNVLGSICMQLTTPGLYGSSVVIRHALAGALRQASEIVPRVSAAGDVDAYVGPGGLWEASGYRTFMQVAQYLTTGLGDYPIRHDVVDGKITHRGVAPHNVYVISHPDRPWEPVELRELRCRFHPFEEKWIWAWDIYDVGVRRRLRSGGWQVVREPRYAVVGVKTTVVGTSVKSELGEDLSNLFLSTPEQDATGGLSGARYPFRDQTGTPFMPWTIHRAADTRATWNWKHRRGAVRGTLNAAKYATFTGHAALDASGRTVIAVGIRPLGASVRAPGTRDRTRSVQLSPGTILYHQPMTENGNFAVTEVGPGANVAALQAHDEGYERRQLRRWGIDSAGAEKGASDPTSGAAKFISRQNMREYADSVRPLNTANDQHALYVCAALLWIAGVGDWPLDGYTLEYAPIALSEDERVAERNDLDWELKHGHSSEVAAYMRRHPGTSRPDAIAALTRSQADRIELEQSVRAELESRGVTTPPPAVDLDVGKVTAIQDAIKQASTGEMSRETLQEFCTRVIGLPAADSAALAATVQIRSTPGSGTGPAPAAELAPAAAATQPGMGRDDIVGMLVAHYSAMDLLPLADCERMMLAKPAFPFLVPPAGQDWVYRGIAGVSAADVEQLLGRAPVGAELVRAPGTASHPERDRCWSLRPSVAAFFAAGWYTGVMEGTWGVVHIARFDASAFLLNGDLVSAIPEIAAVKVRAWGGSQISQVTGTEGEVITPRAIVDEALVVIPSGTNPAIITRLILEGIGVSPDATPGNVSSPAGPPSREPAREAA